MVANSERLKNLKGFSGSAVRSEISEDTNFQFFKLYQSRPGSGYSKKHFRKEKIFQKPDYSEIWQNLACWSALTQQQLECINDWRWLICTVSSAEFSKENNELRQFGSAIALESAVQQRQTASSSSINSTSRELFGNTALSCFWSCRVLPNRWEVPARKPWVAVKAATDETDRLSIIRTTDVESKSSKDAPRNENGCGQSDALEFIKFKISKWCADLTGERFKFEILGRLEGSKELAGRRQDNVTKLSAFSAMPPNFGGQSV